MVIELLGKDLGGYFKTYKQLSLKSGLQLLEQLLSIFSQVHQRGIMHRDLKPENIMMGKANTALAYLVDFGVSKQIIDKGKHIPFKEKKSFIGTTRYASIAAHKGFEIGRKDDLESLMYVIIYLILGKLPWQNLQNIGDKDRTIAVGEVKMATTISQLCRDLPKEFTEYLNYLKGLSFEQQPDYELLKKILRKCAENNKIIYDNQFEWTDKKDIGDGKQQSSFLAVPGDAGGQRQSSKKQSYVSSQSSNVVKYVPSFQEAVQVKAPLHQKIFSSQPHIEIMKQIQTIDFDDIEENLMDQPTLEQKYLQLEGLEAKFKEENISKVSKSAIHIFDS